MLIASEIKRKAIDKYCFLIYKNCVSLIKQYAM